MAFIMPEQFDISSILKPSSSRVKIELVEPRKLATIRFSGYANQENYEKNLEILNKTLESLEVSTKGEPLLMQYNDPWTPPFLRRNEIAIQVNQ
jgi:SOUL heme-binding protein